MMQLVNETCDPESDEGQPDSRSGGCRERTGRASGACDRRDGAARGCHRQHPGRSGIGDKGSVELIQQFGTVEAALDRADEVKKKTYRESLQNNRDNILLSKELVTIHTERANRVLD
jgi:hypothetical protein